MGKTKIIEEKAKLIRQHIIRMLAASKSGHTAGSLGMADLFSVLYFNTLKHNPKKPNDPTRDYVFLSNGHICPVLYAALAEAGYFPKKELMSIRKLGSRLQGHPHNTALPGIENSGGPLGQGISQAVGAAIALKMDKKRNTVYCFMGDGEQNEGQVWEAALFAGHNKLDNLIAIIDRNNIQIDGFTNEVMNLNSLDAKYKSFGWHVVTIDGHNIEKIRAAYKEAKKIKDKPSIIIAKTVPGKGVSFMQNDYRWHGRAPSREEEKLALQELARQRL